MLIELMQTLKHQSGKKHCSEMLKCILIFIHFNVSMCLLSPTAMNGFDRLQHVKGALENKYSAVSSNQRKDTFVESGQSCVN